MVYFGQLCGWVESSAEKWNQALDPKIKKYHPIPLGHNKNLRPLHPKPALKLPINANKTKHKTYLPIPITNSITSTITNLTLIQHPQK